MKSWAIVYGRYEGMEKKAAELLAATMREYLDYEIPLFSASEMEKEKLNGRSIVFLGTPKDNAFLAEKYACVANGCEHGYALCVEEEGKENKVFIVGNSLQGSYYGAVDFIGEYLPTVPVRLLANANVNISGVFDAPFQKTMPTYFKESAPKINRRAIWTWGHCIFDYRKFFENMAKLKLNEIVIWNDSMPLNAKEVVECAHSWGIRVIFGFSWGWGVSCGEFNAKDCFDKEKVKAFAASAIEYYEKNISSTPADGIYFQSFTELSVDKIGDVLIAEAVCAWVNGIAEEFFKKYPDLEIQFGLHATSVREHLPYLAKIDERITIVWEDCGAFPYNYAPSAVENFAETERLTDDILALRGEKEKFGAVFKGMTTLYWDIFKHIDEPYILGEASERKIDEVYEDRKRAWKYIQAEWLKNADYVKKMTERIAKKTNGKTDIQLLVEYGAFEREIFFPVALAAAFLWDYTADASEIIERVSLNPFVKFANL